MPTKRLAFVLLCLVVPASAADKPLTRIAFGSCAKQNKPQPIWNTIADGKPQLFLFIGDNIYGDTEDMSVLKAKYKQLGEKPGYKKLKKNCRHSGNLGRSRLRRERRWARVPEEERVAAGVSRLLRRTGGFSATEA